METLNTISRTPPAQPNDYEESTSNDNEESTNNDNEGSTNVVDQALPLHSSAIHVNNHSLLDEALRAGIARVSCRIGLGAGCISLCLSGALAVTFENPYCLLLSPAIAVFGCGLSCAMYSVALLV